VFYIEEIIICLSSLGMYMDIETKMGHCLIIGTFIAGLGGSASSIEVESYAGRVT
jgi:hypothetical protein